MRRCRSRPPAATHKASLEGLAIDSLRYYPAALDPNFANNGLDLGYLTTLPGARSAYYEANNFISHAGLLLISAKIFLARNHGESSCRAE